MGEGYLTFYIALAKHNGSSVTRVGDCEGIIDEITCFELREQPEALHALWFKTKIRRTAA